MRQKENLISFINAYSQKADILGGKVLTKNNMLGGKIIITDDDHLCEIHAQEIKRLQNTGNIAYDMLYLVPHSLVKKTTCGSQFELRSQFEQNGIYYWDGTSANNRDGYSVNADEVRLLQYDSARGLEGWTVMCLDFDVFLDEKDSEYVDGNVDSLMLESPQERRKKYLYNWAMIPLTRTIDTLVITLRDPEAKVGKILRELSNEFPDFVSWI